MEVGRIRMGHRVETDKGVKRPARLDHWRVTTPDRMRADQIAERYGGEVQEWEGNAGQWEIYTEVDQLPIVLLPGHDLSQWYELWSGGGCKRRCDGRREFISDTPCICQDLEERECSPHTRLNVLLPDIKGFGFWLLTSSGWHAARELSGMAEFLQMITAQGEFVAARLRIDQRSEISDGQTKRYAVPVIDVDVSLSDVLSSAPGLLPGGQAYTPVTNARGVSLQDGLRALEASATEPLPKRGGRKAAPLGPVEPPPERPEPLPQPESEGDDRESGGQPSEPGGSGAASDSNIISDNQRTRLWALVSSLKIPEDDVRRIVAEVTGAESTKTIPRELYDAVYASLQAVGPSGDDDD